MTKRPYVSFAEVKQKVPIPDVLAEFGIAERFSRKGNTLAGVCPLPTHAHGPVPNAQQFKISRRDGIWLWHCFGDCQRGGDVVELVKGLTGYDDAHVRFWFAEKFGDRLSLVKPKRNGKTKGKAAVEKDTTREAPKESPQVAPNAPSNLPANRQPLKPLRFRLNLDPDVPYLQKRGLSRETIVRYGVGLCSKGLLSGYVAIPVHRWPGEPDENPVAYLGRWPSDDPDDFADRPRYKWPEGFEKSRVVFGLQQALAESDGPLIVVEGPLTVLHLAQCGKASAVALFGSAMSNDQRDLLAQADRPLMLMLDGDEAGRKGTTIAAGKLLTRAFVRAVRLSQGSKPDSLSHRQLAELLP